MNFVELFNVLLLFFLKSNQNSWNFKKQSISTLQHFMKNSHKIKIRYISINLISFVLNKALNSFKWLNQVLRLSCLVVENTSSAHNPYKTHKIIKEHLKHLLRQFVQITTGLAIDLHKRKTRASISDHTN